MRAPAWENPGESSPGRNRWNRGKGNAQLAKEERLVVMVAEERTLYLK